MVRNYELAHTCIHVRSFRMEDWTRNSAAWVQMAVRDVESSLQGLRCRGVHGGHKAYPQRLGGFELVERDGHPTPPLNPTTELLIENESLKEKRGWREMESKLPPPPETPRKQIGPERLCVSALKNVSGDVA